MYSGGNITLDGDIDPNEMFIMSASNFVPPPLGRKTISFDAFDSIFGITVSDDNSARVVIDTGTPDDIVALTSDEVNLPVTQVPLPLYVNEIEPADLTRLVLPDLSLNCVDGYSQADREATYFAAAGLLIVEARFTCHDDPVFCGRLELLSENLNKLVLFGQQVTDLDFPNLGYNVIPSTMMTNLGGVFNGNFFPVHGTGEHILYGGRPVINDFQIPLVRFRTSSGWHSFLFARRRAIRVESDSSAVFEYDKKCGKLFCVSGSPKTNFGYYTAALCELPVPDGDSMVYVINDVDYRVDSEPVLNLRASKRDTHYVFNSYQGVPMFSMDGRFIDGGIYDCKTGLPLKLSDQRSAMPNEVINALKKAPKLAMMPRKPGGRIFVDRRYARPVRTGTSYGLDTLGLTMPMSQFIITRNVLTGFLSTDLGYYFNFVTKSPIVTNGDFLNHCREQHTFYRNMRGYKIPVISPDKKIDLSDWNRHSLARDSKARHTRKFVEIRVNATPRGIKILMANITGVRSAPSSAFIGIVRIALNTYNLIAFLDEFWMYCLFSTLERAQVISDVQLVERRAPPDKRVKEESAVKVLLVD